MEWLQIIKKSIPRLQHRGKNMDTTESVVKENV